MSGQFRNVRATIDGDRLLENDEIFLQEFRRVFIPAQINCWLSQQPTARRGSDALLAVTKTQQTHLTAGESAHERSATPQVSFDFRSSAVQEAAAADASAKLAGAGGGGGGGSARSMPPADDENSPLLRVHARHVDSSSAASSPCPLEHHHSD